MVQFSQSEINNVDIPLEVALCEAAISRDEQNMDYLIAQGANINKALLKAAQRRSQGAVDILCAKGGDLPLVFYEAACQRQTINMQSLFNVGADVEVAIAIARQRNDVLAVNRLQVFLPLVEEIQPISQCMR